MKIVTKYRGSLITAVGDIEAKSNVEYKKLEQRSQTCNIFVVTTESGFPLKESPIMSHMAFFLMLSPLRLIGSRLDTFENKQIAGIYISY